MCKLTTLADSLPVAAIANDLISCKSARKNDDLGRLHTNRNVLSTCDYLVESQFLIELVSISSFNNSSTEKSDSTYCGCRWYSRMKFRQVLTLRSDGTHAELNDS
jgi:hypothetical protein